MEFTNRRERARAEPLAEQFVTSGGAPVLVWCGNGHATKAVIDDWTPMGHHFAALTGVDQVVVDQTVTVHWPGRDHTYADAVVAEAADALDAFGGTAGVFSENATGLLTTLDHADAFVVSRDNAME